MQKNLTDVQSRPDTRGIALDRVGVSGLRYPIRVTEAGQATVGTFAMSVSLPREARGTHMSRFVEELHGAADDLSFAGFRALTERLAERLDAPSAHVSVRFPFFVLRAAPVTGGEAYVDVDCAMHARFDRGNDERDPFDLELEVRVPATSLCPCSKEISDYGAHNQRGFITIRLRQRDAFAPDAMGFGTLIGIAEDAASCRVHALLKRPDERAVTMAAFEKPAFVEDMARDCAARLQADDRTLSFDIAVENEESIHTHNAFAGLSWCRVGAAATPTGNAATNGCRANGHPTESRPPETRAGA